MKCNNMYEVGTAVRCHDSPGLRSQSQYSSMYVQGRFAAGRFGARRFARRLHAMSSAVYSSSIRNLACCR